MSDITRRLRALQGELVTVQAFLQEHPGYSTAVANAQLLLERMKKQIAAVLDTEGCDCGVENAQANRATVGATHEKDCPAVLDTEGDRPTTPDLRFYGHDTKGHWRQCRYCMAYWQVKVDGVETGYIVQHVEPCPVGELERLRADTEEDQPVATRHSVEDEVRESFLRGHLDTEGDRLTPLHILDPQIYEADWDGELDPEVFQGQKFVRLEEYRKLQGIAAPERDTRPLAPPTDAAMSTDGEDGQ